MGNCIFVCTPPSFCHSILERLGGWEGELAILGACVLQCYDVLMVPVPNCKVVATALRSVVSFHVKHWLKMLCLSCSLGPMLWIDGKR